MGPKISSLAIIIFRYILAGCIVAFAINVFPTPAVQAFAGTWASIQSMNYGRYGHTSTYLVSGPQAGKVLVVGGTLNTSFPSTGNLSGLVAPAADGSGLTASQTAELYDPANVTTPWTLTASLNVPRVYHTATWIGNGKVLVAGGANASTNNSLNSAEIYDPVGGPNQTAIWTPTVNNMANAHINATATLLDDGRVLVAGGYSGGVMSGNATNSVEIFDPVSKTWSSAQHMNHARTYHTATLIHPTGATTGRVLVVGGSTAAYSATGTALSSAEVYDPTTNIWTDVQALHLARSDQSATLLENGQVLIAGGYNPGLSDDQMYLASVEIYDPNAKTWTNTTALTNARGYHTATLLENGPQNGKVLVAGGSDSTTSVINAELFDPATAVWQDAGDILDTYGGRVSHTATLLSTGNVLIAGGFLGVGSAVSADETAEIYMPLLAQTISVVQNAPASAAYKSTFMVSATAPGGPVTYSSGSPAICSADSNGTFAMIKGTGGCIVQFDQAGNDIYAAARFTQTVAALSINQTISIAQDAPASAAYQSTFKVSATSDASLGVVYSSGSSAVCTADSSGTFTMVKGSGICLVQFDQPGDDNFNAASQQTTQVAAQKINQVLTFSASGTRPFGSDFSVSASTTSNLLLSFGIDGNSTCTILSTSKDATDTSKTNAVIHPTGAGTCAIHAVQGGDENYNPVVQISQSITIVQADQIITVTHAAPTNAEYNSQFSVAATAPGGTVTYSSGSTSICTNNGATFTMISGSGICIVRFDQGGSANYKAAAQIKSNVNATKASQTIHVTTAAPTSAGYNTHFTIVASAPGGTVTYSSGSPTVCSNSGAVFTMLTGTGTCLVWIDDSGDANYTAAPQVIESVNALKIDQTFTFGTHAPGSAAYNSHFTVAATAPGGTVTYSSTSPSICSNSGAVYTMLHGTGTCTVRYDQAGNSNYNSVSSSESVTATKINQAIVVNQDAPTTAAYNSSFAVGATAPGGSVVYSSGSPSVCKVTNVTFTLLTGTGDCLVQYDQSGNNDYNGAPQITQRVTAHRIDQNISISQDAPAMAVYHSTFHVAASSDSSLNVVYSSGSTSVCIVDMAGTFTMQKGSGTCLVQFDQPGNDNYYPAQGKFSTTTAAKASQSISFELAQVTYSYGDADFTLSAVSDSALPVTMIMGQADPCALTGNLVHINHAGSCTVTTTQNGDDNYDAAIPVVKQITILKQITSIFLTDQSYIVDGQPKALIATPTVDCAVIVTYTGTGNTVYGPSGLAPTMIGTYSVTAELDDVDYQGTASAVLVIEPQQVFLPMIQSH